MARAQPGVLREEDLPVLAAGDVLRSLQEVAQPVDPLVPADQDQARFAGRLHRTEVIGLRVLYRLRHPRAAGSTELVAERDRARALLTDVVSGLVHRLLFFR